MYIHTFEFGDLIPGATSVCIIVCVRCHLGKYYKIQYTLCIYGTCN